MSASAWSVIKARALVNIGKQPGHDVSDEPRDESGKWTSGGGDGGSDKPAAATEHPIDPAVIAVGGDEWNRATAARLEKEYKASKAEIEKLATEAVGKEVEKPPKGEDDEEEAYVPEEFDGLSLDDQETVKEHYVEHNESSYYDEEVNSWSENDAPYEAKTKVAEDFTDGSETQWALDAINDLNDYREEHDEPKIPYTSQQILDALVIDQSDAAQGYHMDNTKGLEISFDDDKLKEPSNAPPPEQTTLPGIEPADLSAHLTDEMRKDIVEQIETSFIERAEKVADGLEPPEYLHESAKEFVSESFEEMSDTQKFEYAKNSTDVVDKYEEKAKGVTVETEGVDFIEQLPSKYDPLNDTSGKDYRLTQMLARYLSIHRAAGILKTRGLLPTKEELVAVDSSAPYLKENASALQDYLSKVDKKLWEAWKGSSTSQDGKLLQLATADELNGRLREEQIVDDRDGLQAYANKKWEAIGGYKGIKAYVRAKWETTQYLLDKADVKELPLYRGIVLPAGELKKVWKQITTPIGGPIVEAGTFQLLPNVKIERNGAASTTTDITVANGWKKDTEGHITLRALVPRTAAVSVPAYGINVHSEHEVVVAGTAWKGWDAWRGKAPSLSYIPLQQAA